jgi:hypothetical protein
MSDVPLDTSALPVCTTCKVRRIEPKDVYERRGRTQAYSRCRVCRRVEKLTDFPQHLMVKSSPQTPVESNSEPTLASPNRLKHPDQGPARLQKRIHQINPTPTTPKKQSLESEDSDKTPPPKRRKPPSKADTVTVPIPGTNPQAICQENARQWANELGPERESLLRHGAIMHKWLTPVCSELTCANGTVRWKDLLERLRDLYSFRRAMSQCITISAIELITTSLNNHVSQANLPCKYASLHSLNLLIYDREV